MVFLPEVKLSEKIILPSTADLPEADQAWVVLKDKFLAGDLERVLKSNSLVDNPTEGIINAAGLIADWNYFDRENPEQKLPINVDTVQLLQGQDLIFLKDKIREHIGIAMDVEIDDDQKKTSLDTLTPSGTAENPTPANLPVI